MMNRLRMAINSLVLKIIFGIIILSFIISSISSYIVGIKHVNYLAKVNNQKISRKQFENALMIERNRLYQQIGDKRYSEIFSNEKNLKELHQYVLNHLIDTTLLNLYAKKLGIKINDDQLKKVILSNSEFYSNGKFDNNQYLSSVERMGISTEIYAQNLRDQLITKTLIQAIVNTDFLLKNETRKLMELLTQNRVVRIANINIDAFSKYQEVNETEINHYYKKNEHKFTIPEKFCVSYIKLDTKLIKENASDSEIKDYYNLHKTQFFQPTRIRYSIIQTKTENDAKAVLKEINKGMNFSEIARSKSIDIFSAKRGGDIGWIEEQFIPDELVNINLKNKGQISDIIKFSSGYLVVKLDDISPAHCKPLHELYNEISEKIKKEKILSTYRKIHEKIYFLVKDGKLSLRNSELIEGFKSVNTDWFSLDTIPPELNFKPIIDNIFNSSQLLSKNSKLSNNFDLIVINEGLSFLLCITAYQPESKIPLLKLKDKIITEIKYNKAAYQAEVEARKLLKDLKKGIYNETYLLKRIDLNFNMPMLFDRNSEDEITKMVFSLDLPEKNKPSYGLLKTKYGNLLLLSLDGIKNNNVSLSEIEKREIKENIHKNNLQTIIELLLVSLRKEANIKINSSLKEYLNY